MPNIIYFDNASTTKLDQRVKEVFSSALDKYYANPSSIHKLGQEANYVLNKTKDEILALLKCSDHQVIFTSGSTESNNLAIKGVCLRYKSRGNHIITSIYEHPSVLEAFRQLEKEFGFEVTYLYPNSDGIITVEDVKSTIKKETIFVSIMAVNNEIGSINPIEEIADMLKAFPKVIFHSDAAQLIGKTNRTINFNKIDLLTISAHKMHGLVSSGALIKRKKIELLPLASGGGQEYNFRSGTNDLASALAFKKTLELALANQKERYEHVSKLTDCLISYLKDNPSLYELNVSNPINPYIINFSSIKKKGSVVVEALSNAGIMVSSISACHSSKEKGSYVVASLKKSENVYNNTVRVSLDYLNTMEEIDTLVSTLDKIIKDIR
ncbi:MAG: cysteine desulfurase [Bacilli bacterium]|nr:cysteine desulfurase [Bacilli bacterium]